jgi:hypothetical protein
MIRRLPPVRATRALEPRTHGRWASVNLFTSTLRLVPQRSHLAAKNPWLVRHLSDTHS